jgi:flagella basal body P-ring formation protein FlgA
MRALWMCAAMVAAAPFANAAEPASAMVHIDAGDMRSLQDRLLDLAQQRLQPTGWFVDRQRAWLGLSADLPATDTFEVVPAWSVDRPTPPLAFELRPKSPAQPIRAVLAVPLQRDVWIATRRLRKGSAVKCAELGIQRRDMQELPASSLSFPCALAPDVVALRDIAARDVVRSVDIGSAPDVVAGAPVRVSVVTGGISVTTTAIALADARKGDQISVRLQRPARTLRTRVTGPGSVQLTEYGL